VSQNYHFAHKNDKTMMDAEGQQQQPPPLPPPPPPHHQPEVVVTAPPVKTYPADFLEGIRKNPKRELSETKKANHYHHGNKLNSDYKEQPTDAEITSFYLMTKGVYSSVLDYGKDVVIEKMRQFARLEGLKMQPGNQDPTSVQDVISTLTQGESAKVEYNKSDNIRKMLLFKLQYKLWGKQFWTAKAAEYCKKNNIVTVDGSTAKLGSIAATMSETKTWFNKEIQDSCDKAFGTHVGCRDRMRDNSRIESQFFDGKTKVLVMKSSKQPEPTAPEPAGTAPVTAPSSLDVLLSNVEAGDVVEWLRQNNPSLALIATLSTVPAEPDPNKGACLSSDTYSPSKHI